MSVPIFIPSSRQVDSSNLTHFMNWVNLKFGTSFHNYISLHQWSVTEVDLFWSCLFDYFNIIHEGSFSKVKSQDQMPGINWFEGVELNYAEHLARDKNPHSIAIIQIDENRNQSELQWKDLIDQAAQFQALFEKLGLNPGDRVAGYLNNIPEASVSLFATLASGLVWSSASPDFGSAAVIDRFKQIQPKVLIAVDKYQYGGRQFDRLNEIKEICKAIDSIKTLILIDGNRIAEYTDLPSVQMLDWSAIVNSKTSKNIFFKKVPFNHPMWILYSSGTTGLPKAITHSHGGMLLEHLKYTHFHNDIKSGERYFWYTSTGWMMWNFLHATWLAGSTIILYNGHPMYSSKSILWEIAIKFDISHFGTSAPYIHTCMKEGIPIPVLPHLRSISSTGSPLNSDAYDWLYHHFSQEVFLWSMSGGTDMCTAFVGGCSVLPVYKGEIQCVALGCDLHVLDENGDELKHEVGELVIETPMPCMPVYFWNDPDGSKYREAYFEYFKGKWRHGDWIEITEHNGLIIHGRSDTTLKRFGIRIGTAEIYSALAHIPEIEDSLIIHIDKTNSEPWMPLFVKLVQSTAFTTDLIHKIKEAIKTKCSPRHVPDDFYKVNDIPYTISGKKMESLVKKIFQGIGPSSTSNKWSVRNPECLREYELISQELN
ncbi:MAG: acetoacetate--CoA ligase [Saprospiraceae bacterium]|nr:acetoacetate--CoA ligase [Saprospiraceae bacterium]